MKGQALKGHLDLLVLAVLSEGPRHGYAVIEMLRRRSDDAFDLPEGTLYPVLHRLERTGMLVSDWSTREGRKRRTYRLTSKGRRELTRQRSDWERFAVAVTSVVGSGYGWNAST